MSGAKFTPFDQSHVLHKKHEIKSAENFEPFENLNDQINFCKLKKDTM